MITATDPKAPAHDVEDNTNLFAYIRSMNREGKEWTREHAVELSKKYVISQEKVFQWGEQIYNTFKNESDLANGQLVARVEAFLLDRFVFRRNKITRRVLYRPIDSKIFEACHYNDIWRLLQHHSGKDGVKGKYSLSEVQYLLESNFVNDFNPIKDYYDNIPAWDNKTDYIDELASHVQCENQQFWVSQFKKSLVRMVACSVDGIENRIVMTLFTKRQSKGKNRFIKFLCPDKLIEYFKEDPVTADKDSEIALTENFIWHLDELSALSRTDLAGLKSFISRSSSKQRKAYARQEEVRKRIVNFWASSNKSEVLTDIENTRWLCFQVNNIDWDYNNDETGKKNISIDNVWAQAYQLYKSGFKYQLDESERDEQERINKTYETETIEKELIQKYLIQSLPDQPLSEFMRTSDILEYLIKSTGSRLKLNQYNIKSIMSQLDYIETSSLINNKKVKGYYLIKVAVPTAQPDFETTKDQRIAELPF